MKLVNHPTKHIGHILNKINFKKTPILFLDTCFLFDIIRLASRDRYDHQVYEKIIYIKDALASEKVYSVSSEIFITEWNNNIQFVINEAQNAIRESSSKFNRLIKIINETGVSDEIQEMRLEQYKLEDSLIGLTNAIITNTIFLKKPKGIADKALIRVENRLPPAIRTREVKDCVMWETCLSVRSKIKNKKSLFLFLTSNTTDFYDKKKEIHPYIKKEADNKKITITHNFDIVYHKISTL